VRLMLYTNRVYQMTSERMTTFAIVYKRYALTMTPRNKNFGVTR
jgi:hypothetical protein